MEYCPYGQLYEVLRDGKEIPPTLCFSGIQRHRQNFRLWNNESGMRKYKMSCWNSGLDGARSHTHEMCSEKVDICHYLGELAATAYTLPVPGTCPEGFKLLMRQCWSAKLRNRPSFRQILMHLEIASGELRFLPEKTLQSPRIYGEKKLREFPKNESRRLHLPQLEEELIKRRKEELRHAQDVREHYERKLERANNLYMELTACMLQLEEGKRTNQNNSYLYNKRRKSIVRPIIKAQEKLDRLGKKRTHRSGSEVWQHAGCEVPPRNNSRGSMKDIASPLKSQSNHEAMMDDKLNPAGLHLR
ncbi:hypothetical protein Btru_055382 [Bulinus truncatus]|nr:hypothetical protein Btru_055382 [Bulinus truncatus]